MLITLDLTYWKLYCYQTGTLTRSHVPDLITLDLTTLTGPVHINEIHAQLADRSSITVKKASYTACPEINVMHTHNIMVCIVIKTYV